jgi:hypothetical protein
MPANKAFQATLDGAPERTRCGDASSKRARSDHDFVRAAAQPARLLQYNIR